MRDDELMDDLLKKAMAAPPPRLSQDFDARVMRRLRPRRLTPVGRVAIAAYTVVAAAALMWFLRDVPLTSVAAALAISASAAAGTSAYARRLCS